MQTNESGLSLADAADAEFEVRLDAGGPPLVVKKANLRVLGMFEQWMQDRLVERLHRCLVGLDQADKAVVIREGVAAVMKCTAMSPAGLQFMMGQGLPKLLSMCASRAGGPRVEPAEIEARIVAPSPEALMALVGRLVGVRLDPPAPQPGPTA